MKKLLLVLVCCCWWTIVPINAYGDSIEENNSQAIATYFLLVTGGIRKEVKIDPPATKIVVISQSGDSTIRCGDEQNAYSCSPGKRLELIYSTDTPVTKFWGENINDIPVRLQIEVWETASAESMDLDILDPDNNIN